MNNPVTLQITIENIAPANGILLSPLWFGFHDGKFDSFDVGEPASTAIERIAEDGNTTVIAEDFTNAGAGLVQEVIFGPVIPDFFPGETGSVTVTLDAEQASSSYFSYASMILPSNDAFLANDNPRQHRIFDDVGNFIPTSFVISGSEIYDAGTEVNDEDRFHAAGVGPDPLNDFQPNTGVDENGVVLPHPGFIEDGPILTQFPEADFTAPDYAVARITVSLVEDAAAPELIFGTSDSDELEVDVTPEFDGNRDRVFAGAGADLVDASPAAPGKNQIFGGSGADELFASHNDRLFGEAGDDVLDASTGTGGNRLFGGAGNDKLIAGINDRLFGNGDNDSFWAVAVEGNHLYGQQGDDTFFVSIGGGNLIAGGAGADIFSVVDAPSSAGVNIITDFETGVDTIALDELPLEFAELNFTQEGSDTRISDGTQDLFLLRDIQADSLKANDFTFGQFNNPQPDFSIPDTISPEAQALLSTFTLAARDSLVLPAPDDFESWRATYAAVEEIFAPANQAVVDRFQPTLIETELSGVPVLDIRPNDWEDNGQVLVYTHGGAYTLFSAESTLTRSVPVAEDTGLRVIAVDFTPAPFAQFDQITDQVIAVIEALGDEGYEADDLAILGDSAGGSLATGSVLKLQDQGLEAPGAVVLWSPWSDITQTGDSYFTLQDEDPILNYDLALAPSADAYAPTLEDKLNPYVSPVYADYEDGFPPTLIQGGTKEIFLSNFIRHAQALEQAGQVVELDLYDGLWHVFQADWQLPESEQARDKVMDFLEEHFFEEEDQPAEPSQVTLQITLENLSPDSGLLLSPLWFGFHDGSFDLFDVGQTASTAIERIAEDGNTEILVQDFTDTGVGLVQEVISGPVSPDFFPGESGSVTLTLDPTLASSQFLSYASMILPSNDGFFANDDPTAHQLFDAEGNFIPTSFVISGSEIYDAGTEVNDEDRFHAAGVGPDPLNDFQPNTGVDENGVVLPHPGFIEDGPILTQFPGADFTAPDYAVARITVSLVEDTEPESVAKPEPTSTTSPEPQVTSSPKDNNRLLLNSPGDDELFAEDRDRLFGGAGNDILDASAGAGRNRLFGGVGDDELFAGYKDRLFGGMSNDTFYATAGSSKNRLYGQRGNDTFFAGHNDRLVGGDGNDVFFIGTGGDNLITGGNGADTFWIVTGELPDSPNIITDFEVGTDTIALGSTDLTFDDFTFIQEGDQTRITGGGQDLALLLQTRSSDLTAAHFTFV